MSHSYASEYPAGIDFDPAYKKFFEDFYAVSDTPEVHEKYAANFTDDATLIMASKTVNGRAGTLIFCFIFCISFCFSCHILFHCSFRDMVFYDSKSLSFVQSLCLSSISYQTDHDTCTHAEIIGLRKAMWEKVSSRLHSPLKIFPAGAKGADEVMLYGTVSYTFKDGRKGSVDWAARANLVKEDGKVKMKYYQVYLVSLSLRLQMRSK